MAEHARGLPPEAAAFVVAVFDVLADTVEKRRLGFSGSIFIEVLRPFLKAHGIRLETWHSEINIKPVEIPPAGSLGQVLLRNKRAWESMSSPPPTRRLEGVSVFALTP